MFYQVVLDNDSSNETQDFRAFSYELNRSTKNRNASCVSLIKLASSIELPCR